VISNRNSLKSNNPFMRQGDFLALAVEQLASYHAQRSFPDHSTSN